MDSEDEDEKEVSKGPKFPITMYISEGNKYLRLSKYSKAIEFFDTALEWEPTNVKSLIGRSKCNMRLAKYVEAKEDAETTLRSNPKSSEAKLLIGEAEYFLGDFERAFITYYNGQKVRPNCERLKLGHQTCRRAIDNALQPDKPILLDDQDIGNLLNLSPGEDTKLSAKQKTFKDSFSSDVDFINSLLSDNSVESVHPDCEYLLAYLKERQQFWQTQNPGTSKRILKESSEVSRSKIKYRKGNSSEQSQSPEKVEKTADEENGESKITDSEEVNEPAVPIQGEVSEQNGEKSISSDIKEHKLN